MNWRDIDGREIGLGIIQCLEERPYLKFDELVERLAVMGILIDENDLSDILIDPYPFGGCNSSLESFSLYKPLVTQPSIRINGRFTYGFYKKMEMEDMIAYNKEQYVNIINKLLNDKDFYDKQVNLLKERSDKLFMDQQTLDEWEELMSS